MGPGDDEDAGGKGGGDHAPVVHLAEARKRQKVGGAAKDKPRVGASAAYDAALAKQRKKSGDSGGFSGLGSWRGKLWAGVQLVVFLFLVFLLMHFCQPG